RNDQVATDLRLYLRDAIEDVYAGLLVLMQALLDVAERESDTLMPGFTHLQSAQPVTFGHHMLAWFEMLVRDAQRLQDCHARTNIMPLGSAALAGTGYPIDRAYTAELLGFSASSANSLDAVSDRDFAIEFTAGAALIMMHLSRCSEELVLWMSPAFGLVDLDEAWCTGSSIMPQKKNPDIPELCRGKAGRVFGDLQALLTLMKAQPLAYNRDNQEDKASLFDAVDTVSACLTAFAGLVPGITVHRDRCREAAAAGYSTATDLADYLVGRGIPFRDAHAVVGQVVRAAMQQGVELAAMSLEDLKRCSPVIEEDVFAVLTPEGSVASRDHVGGTAPRRVLEAVQAGRQRCQQLQQWREAN
ncbi:MAG: argininosuccinate lyase, partial [Thiotrichales bacterium]|nr:argininosuccinate lyase [Thiotrichales bacterium]